MRPTSGRTNVRAIAIGAAAAAAVFTGALWLQRGEEGGVVLDRGANETAGSSVDAPDGASVDAPLAPPVVAARGAETRESAPRGDVTSADGIDAVAASPEPMADPHCGVTLAHARRTLVAAYERFLESRDAPDDWSRRADELQVVTRSVQNLLRSEGRAIYEEETIATPGADGGATRGHRLMSSAEEGRFASDRALYVVPRGEFPAYDRVRNRMQFQVEGEPVPPMTDAEVADCTRLYERALAALDARAGG